MGSIFSIDSPLMRALSKVADLMILNLLVIVTSIPIITIGASMSAMHYVLIKLTRNEGTSVAQMYFKSFKDNFIQGTVLWLVNIIAVAVFVVDIILFFTSNSLPMAVFVGVSAVGILFLMTCMYFYPLQARFYNPIAKTIRNAFFVMILNFPKSVATLLLYALPLALLFTSFALFPIVILFGIAAPGYGAALLYKSVFMKIEPHEEEVASDMDFHIVTDEEETSSEE